MGIEGHFPPVPSKQTLGKSPPSVWGWGVGHVFLEVVVVFFHLLWVFRKDKIIEWWSSNCAVSGNNLCCCTISFTQHFCDALLWNSMTPGMRLFKKKKKIFIQTSVCIKRFTTMRTNLEKKAMTPPLNRHHSNCADLCKVTKVTMYCLLCLCLSPFKLPDLCLGELSLRTRTSQRPLIKISMWPNPNWTHSC